ncbi:hypothetical protein IID24_05290, partial [Patescibacteria group bacterium]|nr:hypothetical protein [Patescibacteria group bacterium]
MAEEPQNEIKQNGALKPYKDNTLEEFLFWFAMPASERGKTGAETMQEFADEHKVHRNTLTRWKDSPEFQTRAQALRRKWGNEMTAFVFDGWKLACMKGNPHAIELWLSYFEGWDKKQIIEQRKVVEVSANDIRALINELPTERQRHYYGELANLEDELRYTIAKRRESGFYEPDGEGGRNVADYTRALQGQTDHLPQ